MELGIIVLDKISQTQKDKYSCFILIDEIRSKYIHIYFGQI